MQQAKSELKALRQRHEITIMELSDIKEDNARLKKMNITLIENLCKEEPQSYTQLKLIIEGNQYNPRISELEAELERLNSKMEEQIEKRLKQILGQIKNSDNRQCQKCKRGCQKCHKLQLIINEKNDIIDGLRLDLEEVKADLEILVAKNKSCSSSENKDLRKRNEELQVRISDLKKGTIDLQDHHDAIRKIQDKWEKKLRNLQDQYQDALEQSGNFFTEKDQAFSQTEMLSPYNQRKTIKNSQKENEMKKKIQMLAGELAAKKSSVSPIKGGYSNRPNAQSRLMTDSDFSYFTIKDAINRPNHGNYFG